MHDLVNLYYSRYQQQTISSLEIAKSTGQNHNDIIKECDALNSCYKKLALPIIEERIYIVPNVKEQQREFLLTREQQSHLFVLSIINSLNDDSRALVQHLLTQQKPVASKIEKQKDDELKIKNVKSKEVKTEKLLKETKPKKVKAVKTEKPAKPKKIDHSRIEKGLISLFDILKGTKIYIGKAYTKLLDAKIVENITYKNGKGVDKNYYVIKDEFSNFGINQKISGKTTLPLWYESKKDEILNIIKDNDNAMINTNN